MNGFTFGFGPLRGVWITPDLSRLPEAERKAVVLHELGHLFHRHPAKRFVAFLLLRPFWDLKRVRAWAIEQEFEADRFVCDMGHGRALAEYLSRFTGEGGLWHPSPAHRVAKIKQYLISSRLGGVTAPIELRPLRAKEKRHA